MIRSSFTATSIALARRTLSVSRVAANNRNREGTTDPYILTGRTVSSLFSQQFRALSDSSSSERNLPVTTSMNGKVRWVKSGKNDYKVAMLDADKFKGNVKIYGRMPEIRPGDEITVEGQYNHHPMYGEQFHVTNYKLRSELSARAIAVMTPGINAALSQKIVDFADQHGFDRREFVCGVTGNLEAVVGIGKVKAQAIQEVWTTENALREVIEFLASYQIYSQRLCERIVDAYGAKSVEIIKTDPYRIDHIGFKKADRIAMAMGLAKDDQRRIRAYLLYALEEQFERKHGHTAVIQADLVSEVVKALKLPSSNNKMVVEGIDCLAEERKLECTRVDGKLHVQSASLAGAENSIVASLDRIQQGESFLKSSEVDGLVALAETSVSYDLRESQREAVRKGLDNKVSIVTGGPGTGKSAMLSALASTLKKEKNATVKLTAFTGAAAQRLANETKLEASTIHRLLEWDSKSFKYNKHNCLYADYVIVDEASMLSTHLLASLLEALSSKCHIVLVGDIDQLPSIQPGAVLDDIIGSKRFPVTRLDYVFRQGHGSSIVEIAKLINEGDASLPEVATKVDELAEHKDFQFLEAKDDAECAEFILQVYNNFVRASLGSNPVCDTQILIPQYKGIVGIASINKKIQERSSSRSYDLNNKLFRVGDKVVQTKNDYEKDLRNGNIGIVKMLSEKKMVVKFDDDREVEFDLADDEAFNLDLAYALSVHKSQGSEYLVVIVVLTMSHRFTLFRKLLYTAVTRGKQKVIVIGDPLAYKNAVEDAGTRNPRCTLLRHRLSESQHRPMVDVDRTFGCGAPSPSGLDDDDDDHSRVAARSREGSPEQTLRFWWWV